MVGQNALPFITAAAGFGVLLIFLAFSVQRQAPTYRGIAATAATVATLMTTLSYVELASLQQPVLSVAHAEPVVEKVVTAQTVCLRQGVVPACSCTGQR